MDRGTLFAYPTGRSGPVKKLLKGWQTPRRGHDAPTADNAAHRLAVFEDIERTVSGWFWASDAAGHLSYISPAACER